MNTLSFFLAFIGFVLLIVLHEAGHFAAAKAVGMRVERFALFFPPLLLRKKIGETEYAVGAIPAGGYVKISGMNPDEDLPDEVRTRAYYSQPVWKRIVVIAAGPLVNVVLAFILLFVYFAFVGASMTAKPIVDRVEPGYPAAAALKPGDRLISVDGRRGGTEALAKAVAAHRCAQTPPKDRCRASEPAKLVIQRGGQRRTIELTPVYDAQRKRTRLGFGYEPGPRETLPLGRSLDQTAEGLWIVTRETVKLPGYFFDSEKRKQITGVVGNYEITRQTILDDVASAIRILAVISLALAVINLFPFLPLDGGHIFWAIVEKIRRKPVPFSVMERAGAVGVALVLVVFLIGLSNDIGRLTGEGFNVR